MHKYLSEIVNEKVPVIKFDSLEKIGFITHGFSTRQGGVSKGIYESMNLSFNRGDDEENVTKNYEIFSQALGIDVKNLVLSAQTHTTNIMYVTKHDCGKGIFKQKDYDNIDGLITNERNVALVTSYADCVPLFFVDINKRVIALSHSGWRGTVNKMGRVTIDKMVEQYGCNTNDIKCVIGPSICKNCYEVSEDVANEFYNNFTETQCREIIEKKENGKYLIDLWKANEYILLDSGIHNDNIENREICTCCNKDILFSHRGSHGKRGNLCAFLMIN